jgi:hypothetical protein
MIKAISGLVASLLLTGCASLSVNTVALCVGVCRYSIKPPEQSAAERTGALAGGLLEQFLKK